MRRRRVVAGLALFFVLSCSAIPKVSAQLLPAQQDAGKAATNQVLAMTSALNALDYQGSFVYERNGHTDAFRLFHEGSGQGRERLVSLNGPQTEVLRAGDLITYRQADGEVVVFPNKAGTRLLPLIPNIQIRRFSSSYALGLGGEDRMAGYKARIVDVLPRDGYRYGYRLWLEEGSKLPLRVALVDATQQVLEQYMFVSLDIHAAPKESDLALSRSVSSGNDPQELPLGGSPRWRLVDPPPGFLYVRGKQPASAPTSIEHYLYSDGLASVSVYVEPRDPRQPAAPDSAVSRGALNIYVRHEGDWKITVLGDVPRMTVQRIARSMQPLPAGTR